MGQDGIDLNRFLLIAGPCVVEGKEHLFRVAGAIKNEVSKYGMQWVLKASYDKANRTSKSSFRGVGSSKALDLLEEASGGFDVPITSDVHSAEQAKAFGWRLDIIQIPAFLSRQTDILDAAARQQRAINIKKMQTVAPSDVESACEKVWTVNPKLDVIVTERGSQFGYNDVVVDFRRFVPRPRSYRHCMDVTHTVNDWRQSFPLMQAALAVGVRIIFVEVGSQLCDDNRAVPLFKLEQFIRNICDFIKERGERL